MGQPHVHAGQPGEFQYVGVCVVLKCKIKMKILLPDFTHSFISMMFSTYKVAAVMVTRKEVVCNLVCWTFLFTDVAQVKNGLSV